MRGRVVARGHAGGVSDKECASAYEEDKTHLAKTAVHPQANPTWREFARQRIHSCTYGTFALEAVGHDDICTVYFYTTQMPPSKIFHGTVSKIFHGTEEMHQVWGIPTCSFHSNEEYSRFKL